MSWETKLLTGLLLVLIAIVSLTAGVALYLTVNPPPRGTTSPQTFRLAFASDRDGNLEVYVMDGDGQNVRRLTEYPTWDSYPAWSPDGTQLAFLRLSMTEAGEMASVEENGLYLINSDGGDEVQLVSVAKMSVESAPAWSPDGTQIAYTVLEETGTETPRSSIYVVSRQGGEPTAVLTNTYTVSYLSWSPDGAYLLFTSSGGSLGPRVSTLDLETGEVAMLGNPAWTAAFSPT
ncbi:MAG: PD40 domain-containing protein, partial [Anaerolineae bacterium]|nr:PD40 domain-containing protein [Anaerolineae bacterium]